ncbi:MAG: hypothetical protein J0H40_20190 [Rhizobiales bacterium]|nr:hypothetical protein [Hyphomicrobiales bacterium]
MEHKRGGFKVNRTGELPKLGAVIGKVDLAVYSIATSCAEILDNRFYLPKK